MESAVTRAQSESKSNRLGTDKKLLMTGPDFHSEKYSHSGTKARVLDKRERKIAV